MNLIFIGCRWGRQSTYLNVKGAELVAGLYGQLAKDFPWRRKPRWSLISHDLAVNDFRIDVMMATNASPMLTLHRWIPESEFWAHPDTVEYKTAGGRVRKRRSHSRRLFHHSSKTSCESPRRSRRSWLSCLEIDMGTEDNPRFAREKVQARVLPI